MHFMVRRYHQQQSICHHQLCLLISVAQHSWLPLAAFRPRDNSVHPNRCFLLYRLDLGTLHILSAKRGWGAYIVKVPPKTTSPDPDRTIR
uniref:Uncharacterized protein n=1 Tax=Anopheles albimanus TaxID=7167 RepID=A0A182FWU6_ANOAL